MRCPSCGFDNATGIKFCGECGRPLLEAANRAELPKPRAYTPKHLAARILAEQAAMESRGALEGERKTITALFADVKGSVELMQDLDPEDARKIVDPALEIMMDSVHRYEGYVAQSRGDGIFALFGAPIAHEDHPRRAVYAALWMQHEIKRYAQKLRLEKGVDLEIRVGLNTGEVVVRSIRKDDLHTDYVPIGHSINLAARLESLAAPGSIVVSDDTRALTQGYFAFRALDATRVKGVREPVRIHEVTGIGPLRTRLDVSARRGLVRFVGRGLEMSELRQALERAKARRGQIVGVVGEPGVGKSRLLHEFEQDSATGSLVLESFAVSHGKADSYLPLIDLMKSYFAIGPEDDASVKKEKVATKAGILDRSLEDSLPYFFFLLGVLDRSSPLHQMDPQIRRQRALEAITGLLLCETRNQPVLLILEDLHWLDDETHAFVKNLGEAVTAARLLLLVSYRPEYEHPWRNCPHFRELRLDPLEREGAEDMLSAMLGEDLGLRPLKDLILQKSEGNPFFVEEIVQALLDGGLLVRNDTIRLTRSVSDIQVPRSVEAVLAARIDRLAADKKDLLQVAAVIGRRFSPSLLRCVTERTEGELRGLLAELQAAEFLYEEPDPSDSYVVKHALTREVAYRSLLLERRSLLHERVAEAIEGVYRGRLEDHYAELARHYRLSRNAGKAIEYLRRAGVQAMERSVHAEAVAHLRPALELVRSLPGSGERDWQELEILTALGPAVVAIEGYSAPEVEKIYGRAHELCAAVGETPQLFPVLRGLWESCDLGADMKTARRLAERLVTLARSVHDSGLLLVAHEVLGDTLLWMGEFALARRHEEEAVSLYERERHHPLALLHGGYDPGVASRLFLAHALWYLGHPDQALRTIQESIALAEGLSHPHTLVGALVYTSFLHHLRHETEPARARAEAALAISQKHGFAFWAGSANVQYGWALVEQGAAEEGVVRIREGMAQYRAMYAELERPYFVALLVEALARLGRFEEGLVMLAETLAEVDEHGTRFYQAELVRLMGELLSRRTVPDEIQAEAYFRQALEIARSQQARSLELRAATSWSRLLLRRGRSAEARELLAPIYGWFAEGRDTADLKEASALLEERS